MKRPFVKTGYLGLAVIAMSILLLFIFPAKAPSLPEGFFTPIIAFEFAQTKTDVMQIFGGTDLSVCKQMVDAMDLGNRLDYVYMCLYSAFLFMFSVKCAKVFRKKYFYLCALLSLTVLTGDALENVQLLGITAKIASGDFNTQLHLLHIFTWIKWSGIAVIFLGLSLWFFKGRGFSKIIGMTGVISFVLGTAAYLHRSVINEIFSFSVAIMFILMIIYCFTYKVGQHV